MGDRIGAALVGAIAFGVLELISIWNRSPIVISRVGLLIGTIAVLVTIAFPAVLASTLLSSWSLHRTFAERSAVPAGAWSMLAVVVGGLSTWMFNTGSTWLEDQASRLDFPEPVAGLLAVLMGGAVMAMLAGSPWLADAIARGLNRSSSLAIGTRALVVPAVALALAVHDAAHEAASIHQPIAAAGMALGVCILLGVAAASWGVGRGKQAKDVAALAPSPSARRRFGLAVVVFCMLLGAIVAVSVDPGVRFVVHRRSSLSPILATLVSRAPELESLAPAVFPRHLGHPATTEPSMAPRMEPSMEPSMEPACLSARDPETRPDSVLLITVDALAARALSPQRTPALAKLAPQSAWFTEAHAPATSTFWSVRGLMRGLPSSVSGGTTLAEELRETHRTGLVFYFEVPDEIYAPFEEANPGVRDISPRGVKQDLTSADVTEDAVRFLSVPSEEPFFLWVHYADPHAPYLEIQDDYGLGLSPGTPYERLVSYTDHHIGRLLQSLARLGLDSRTAVVVTSDHGEDLGQRGRLGHGPDLFADTTHVPLAVHFPGCAGQVTETPVSLIDVVPTLRQMLGRPPRGFTLFEAQAGLPRPLPVVSERLSFGTGRVVITATHRFHRDLDVDGRVLFDLGEDAAERIDVYPSDAAARQALEALDQAWLTWARVAAQARTAP